LLLISGLSKKLSIAGKVIWPSWRHIDRFVKGAEVALADIPAEDTPGRRDKTVIFTGRQFRLEKAFFPEDTLKLFLQAVVHFFMHIIYV